MVFINVDVKLKLSVEPQREGVGTRHPHPPRSEVVYCYVCFFHSGWLAVCSTDVGHITHLRCAIRRFGVLRLTCSHCGDSCAPACRSEIVADSADGLLVFADNADALVSLSSVAEQIVQLHRTKTIQRFLFTVSSILMCNCNLQQHFTDLLFTLEKKDEKEVLHHLVRFLLHCYMPQSQVWWNGELLSAVIETGCEEDVIALREAGCPVCPHHLRLLSRSTSSSLFYNLFMEPEYATALVSEALIVELVTVRSWHYLLRLLEHFDYKVNVNDPRSSMEKTARLEDCNEVPNEVQFAIRRMFQMSKAPIFTLRRKIVHEDLSKGSERFPVRVVNDADSATVAAFIYTSRVVDRNGVLAARSNSVVAFCCCDDVCSSGCVCNSGAYNEHGLVDEISLEWPFVECSAACTCSLQCGNRVAQKGATIPIEVFRTCDGRGWAVRALRNIRRGAFIGEYTGELLSDAETTRPERTDTYFFETRVGEELYTIDARLYGNFTRFVNHSCRPNATVAMVVWEAQPEQLCHICIFATENIPKGMEITISYGQSWWNVKVRILVPLS
ncbi:hypothetical protein GCK32_002977 [Trichostrongylus colubriformis]|uniref:SET domain-containing protein n=1 Tax=Trichostrongylus colubriformis TaxID=6319 RepID=A0AAN8ICW1_TRICO